MHFLEKMAHLFFLKIEAFKNVSVKKCINLGKNRIHVRGKEHTGPFTLV